MDHLSSPFPTVSLPRKPGAQLGNINALRHGFYSRRFRKRELADLETGDFKGLNDEIALLRIFTRRLAECHTPAADLYDTILLVRTLCLSSSCLNRMVKTQQMLASSNARDQFDNALETALNQVMEELGIDEDWPNSPPSSETTEP